MKLNQRKSKVIKVRRWGRYRQKYWVHALIVGVLLTCEIHLFSSEILHHHEEVARVCQIEHPGGQYLHSPLDLRPLCPLCQIIRNSSLCAAVLPLYQRPDGATPFRLITRRPRFSSILTPPLLARAPPLS